MLHRKIVYDDAYGKENLNQLGEDGKGLVVRGHYLLVSSKSDRAKLHTNLLQQLYQKPLITFSNLNITKHDYFAKYNTIYSYLTDSLPPNVLRLPGVLLLTFCPVSCPVYGSQVSIGFRQDTLKFFYLLTVYFSQC